MAPNPAPMPTNITNTANKNDCKSLSLMSIYPCDTILYKLARAAYLVIPAPLFRGNDMLPQVIKHQNTGASVKDPFNSKHSLSKRLSTINWAPLIVLVCLLIVFLYFGIHRYVTLDTLRKYQFVIQSWTQHHYILSVFLYLLIFSFLIACTIPCGTILTMFGGFLFGYIAILYAVFSTTFGGMILYFAIRTSIGTRVAEKSSGWIKKMEQGFQRDAFHYLLSLRLIPVLPCWISNIAAGMLNVPLKTFIMATIVGITPSIIIYVMAGRSLDTLLSTQGTPIDKLLFSPSIFFPLLGLAFLSLFPVIYRYTKRYKSND